MKRHQIGIVGGSGFIGSSIASHLAKRYNVKIIDVSNPPECLDGMVEFLKCDIRQGEEVYYALSDLDVVIHTAIVQIPLINEQKKLGYEVNIVGTQNVCRAVEMSVQAKGMILASTWHTIGEKDLNGMIDEEFGFRPDKVEERARLYALSKVGQESIVRFYDEICDKVFGVIRMGTVLGKDMPKGTAANIFIESAINGKLITPYKHSMYRPMLYVDIKDVCCAYEAYLQKILNGTLEKQTNSLDHIVNVYYPKPVSILELAQIIRDVVEEFSRGKITPKIRVVDTGQQQVFTESDVLEIEVDIGKVTSFLGLSQLTSPHASVARIVRDRLARRIREPVQA